MSKTKTAQQTDDGVHMQYDPATGDCVPADHGTPERASANQQQASVSLQQSLRVASIGNPVECLLADGHTIVYAIGERDGWAVVATHLRPSLDELRTVAANSIYIV